MLNLPEDQQWLPRGEYGPPAYDYSDGRPEMWCWPKGGGPDESKVTPKAVAAIPWSTLVRITNLGKLGIRDVEAWLAEHGMQITGKPEGRVSTVSQAPLEEAKKP